MKLSILFLILMQITLANRAFAWQLDCVPTSEVPGHASAIMKNNGSSVAIAVTIGYINADLLCSYRGPCVGFTFGGPKPIASDAANLFRDNQGDITGFRIMDFTFKCEH